MKRIAFLLLSCLSSAAAQELSLGTAAVDITPPSGAPMAGYYTNREATGAHDPLQAKAMVLSDGSTKIAVVACDLVSLPRDVSEAARAIVAKKLSLEPDHVMITATHSHTTPVVLTNPTRYNLTGKTKQIAEAYTEALPGKIAEAIVKADAAMLPVKLRAGVGEENTLGFNRRFFMKDGSIGWNPGKLNPNILRPAGPVDTGVPVLYFESAGDQKPVAAYVNFALHQDTTGGFQFSADYAYSLARTVQLAKGDDFFTLFTIGAAGNVNHIDTASKEPQQSFEEAARIGSVLAGVVLTVIKQAQPVENTRIQVSDEVLKLAMPTYTAAEIADANRTQATQGTAHPAPFLNLVKAARVIELNARHGKPLDGEVQVFTIGKTVAIVGFPGEMFAEFGIQLKEDSPFPVTVPSELANGDYGYIPNRIAFAEGNYEPTAARTPLGTGEQLVDSAERQLLLMAQKNADGK